MAGGGRPGIPWVALNADRRAAAELALPITTTGWPAPAGKWLASTVSPTTESGWPRKACALVRPLAVAPVSPRARTPSTTAALLPTSPCRGASEGTRVTGAGGGGEDGGAGGGGEGVDGAGGRGQQHGRREHGEQAEYGASVSDQQNHDHDGQRGVQQGAVDALERLGRIGRV